jgi:hypothetical protein
MALLSIYLFAACHSSQMDAALWFTTLSTASSGAWQ